MRSGLVVAPTGVIVSLKESKMFHQVVLIEKGVFFGVLLFFLSTPHGLAYGAHMHFLRTGSREAVLLMGYKCVWGVSFHHKGGLPSPICRKMCCVDVCANTGNLSAFLSLLLMDTKVVWSKCFIFDLFVPNLFDPKKNDVGSQKI